MHHEFWLLLGCFVEVWKRGLLPICKFLYVLLFQLSCNRQWQVCKEKKKNPPKSLVPHCRIYNGLSRGQVIICLWVWNLLVRDKRLHLNDWYKCHLCFRYIPPWVNFWVWHEHLALSQVLTKCCVGREMVVFVWSCWRGLFLRGCISAYATRKGL